MKHVVLMLSLVLGCQVSASVLVNEVMYDPVGTDTGHEWIEVVNTGSDLVDITDWKLFEANSNHGLTVVRGGFVLDAGAIAIIADNAVQFIADYPMFTGTVFDSAFSLNNSGETFEIRNQSLEIQDSFSYTSSLGATENGASLTKTSTSSWIQALPTPGSVNNQSPYSDSSQNNNSGSSGSGGGSNNSSSSPSSTTTAGSAKKDQVKPKDFDPFYRGTLIKDKEVVTIATPVILEILIEKVEPKGVTQVASGNTYISFGDGTKLELDRIRPITHEWQKAGTYTVVVTYKSSKLFTKPFVTIKQLVTVVNPTIELSIDDSNNITITNFGEDTLDVSGWYLTQGLDDVQIPEGTFIEKKASIVISGNLTTYQGGSLELLTSSGVSVIDYVPQQEQTLNSNDKFESTIKNNQNNKNTFTSTVVKDSNILDNNSFFEKEKAASRLLLDWYALLFLVVVIGSYLVIRVSLLGSLVSFSFVGISESEEMPDEIIEDTFFF